MVAPPTQPRRLSNANESRAGGRPWQATGAVLGRFARAPRQARRAYRGFVAAAVTQGRRPELQGGGLVRSLGGWRAVQALGRGREGFRADERVLGTSPFVERLLREVEDRPAAPGVTAEDLLHRVCRHLRIPAAALAAGSRRRAVSRAGGDRLPLDRGVRAQRPLMPWLGVPAQSVYKASARGRAAAAEWSRLLAKR